MSLPAPLMTLFSRPCRRTAALIAVWTCFCWLLFRVSNDDAGFHSQVMIRLDLNTKSLTAQVDRVNLNTRELLGKLGMTGKGESSNATTSTTLLADRGSGSTTETGEINYLDAVPAIDR